MDRRDPVFDLRGEYLVSLGGDARLVYEDGYAGASVVAMPDGRCLWVCGQHEGRPGLEGEWTSAVEVVKALLADGVRPNGELWQLLVTEVAAGKASAADVVKALLAEGITPDGELWRLVDAEVAAGGEPPFGEIDDGYEEIIRADAKAARAARNAKPANDEAPPANDAQSAAVDAGDGVEAVAKPEKRKRKKVSKAEAEKLANKYFFIDNLPWPGYRKLAADINYWPSKVCELSSVQKFLKENPDALPANSPPTIGINEANEASITIGEKHGVLNEVIKNEDAERELQRLAAEREKLEAERKRLTDIEEIAKEQAAEHRADFAPRKVMGKAVGRRRKA